MIPKRYIEEWREFAPWPNDFQVEQDLIIERALFEIYNDEALSGQLAFRGGTAIHKLFLNSPARYSEDIDLVQISPQPIGNTLSRLRKVLSFIQGKITFDNKNSNTTMNIRYISEFQPFVSMKLKIEINCREHLNVFGTNSINGKIKSTWFSSDVNIKTYYSEEILATKLRALYQRSKGRDLFDLGYTLQEIKPDATKIIYAFKEYLSYNNISISSADFVKNLEVKMNDPNFISDINGLIRPGFEFDLSKYFIDLKENVLRNI